MPVQLLECVYLLALFAVLVFRVDFRRRAALYLVFAAAGRFGFEFLRGDNRGSVFDSVFSPAQCLGAALFAFGLLMYLRPLRRPGFPPRGGEISKNLLK